jgi:RNA polymerase sigma-70 factor, ECF subfamily
LSSDQELIRLINEGDTDAFEGLYRRYRDWVFRLAWRFTSNQQDSLDVLQETFIYLLGKFPGFSLTASMTTFLYPVVKHISQTVQSKSRRFTSDEEKLNQITIAVSEEIHTSRSELATVLGILGDEQREILLMRFVDDMSFREISAALDIPEGTVKSRFYHALQRLRDDRRTREYFIE